MFANTAEDTADQAGCWRAALQLGFAPRGPRTALVERRHQGPLTVLRPFYPEGGVCHVYPIHPPGGVVGGDSLQIGVTVAAGGQALLTTPGAGKFYRSAGAVARQRVVLQVEAGASLEWLPQEAIFYDGAAVDCELEIQLQAEAAFIGWEIAVLGRPAAGERFVNGGVSLACRVYRQSQPLYLQRLWLDAAAVAAMAGLQGQPVCGEMLVYPADRRHLQLAQALCGEDAWRSATLLADLLVCRAIGDRADRLRQFFETVWAALRPELIGRPPCRPRIWAT